MEYHEIIVKYHVITVAYHVIIMKTSVLYWYVTVCVEMTVVERWRSDGVKE